MKLLVEFDIDADISQEELEQIFLSNFEPANALLSEENMVFINSWEIKEKS